MVKIVDGDWISNKPIYEHGGLIVKGKVVAPGISCSGLRARDIQCEGRILSDKPIECDGDIFTSDYISCGATISAGGDIVSKKFVVAGGPINASGSIVVAEKLGSESGITAGKFIVAGYIDAKGNLRAEFGIFSRGHIWSGGVIEAKLFVVSLSEVCSGMNNPEFPKISVGQGLSGWGMVVARFASGLSEDELWRYLPVGERVFEEGRKK